MRVERLTTLLQSNWRGLQGRRRIKYFMQIQAEVRWKDKAARSLQKGYRGLHDRKVERTAWHIRIWSLHN